MIQQAHTQREPKRAPYLSVVIPAYQAEGFIRLTVDAVVNHAARHDWPIEIIVSVSEGGDRTREEAMAAARQHGSVTVLDTTSVFGKGGAVTAGMKLARGDVRCYIDADNGAPFEQIDAMLPLLADYDVVIGSRYVEGGDAGRRSLPRALLSRGGKFLINVTLGLDYADTRAPLKVLRGEAAERLFSQVRLRGFGFESELLFLAARYGLRVREFPVRWSSSEETTVRFGRDALRSILELVQIRWHWRRGHYAR